MGFARPDDDARNDRFGEQPGDGNLGYARLATPGDLAHPFDDFESGLLVERQKVEAGEPVLAVLQIFACVLAAQEASGERAPHRHAQASISHERYDLVLNVAPDER